MVLLRLLGGLGLDGPSGPVTGPAAQRKRLALLALLVLSPDRRLSRDKLIAYLWPESDAERARHQVSSALYEIRRAAGEDAILGAGDELRLNGDVVRADVAEFKAALETGDVARAVAVYQGPLLDGFFLGDAPEFERWVDRERERLAGDYSRALEVLAEAAEERGDHQAAVDWWKARAAHDPYDSRVGIRLMRALDASGNRAGALQHAAMHERLLREEFGVDPDPELLALAERLRSTAGKGVEPEADRGDDSAHDSAGPPQPMRVQTVEARPSRMQRPWSWPVRRSATAVGLVVLGALAVLLAAFWLSQQASPVLGAPRVLVAPFENRTGDPALDPVGGMAADWIAQRLSQTGAVDVVTASAGLRMNQDQAGPAASRETGLAEAVHALAEAMGAALVISGAYYRRGDSIQFHTQLTDPHERRLLRSLEPITAPPADPGPALEEVGRRAAAAAAVAVDTRLARLGKLASPPSNYEAYLACLEGLDPFFAWDWPVAMRHFERALELDSTFLFPRIHIGYVHYVLGELAEADSIVRVLNRSRARMTRFELAILDLLSAYVAEDPVASYEAAKRAAAISPGSPPHVQWGGEALRLNRPREAIGILSAVEPEAAPLGGWSLYWSSLTGAYHQLGRHRAELRHARRARALHPNDSWPLLIEARALAALGRPAALEALVFARKSLPDHQPPRPGEMMTAIGHELMVHGHLDAARDWFERAADWYRGRPAEERAQAGHRQQLAFALLAMDRPDEAESKLQQLDVEDRGNVAIQGVLGVLAARRGDAAEAGRIDDRLAALRQPYRAGDQLLWRACILAHLDELAPALSLLQEAAGRAARFDHTHFCLDPLRDYPPFREFVRPRG